jgi:plastocyanin
MTKRLFILLILYGVATVIVAACASASSASGSDPRTSDNQVHMNDSNFVQASVTIKKGESVTLVADTLVSHTIANGTWDSGMPKPFKEPGAPTIDNVSVGGDSSVTIGPFTNAGTFKLYCTIHPGMDLTVIVR